MKRELKIFIKIFIIFHIVHVIKSEEFKLPLNRAQNETANCPKLSKWDSLDPKEVFYVTYPAEYVVIHHTMGLKCFNPQICKRIVKNIQIYSMNVMSYPDIKYNFLIGDDGNIYPGTGWFRKGFHTSEEIDEKSISIAFIGDFTDSLPLNEAIEKLHSLLKCGKSEGYFAKNYKLVAAFQLTDSTESPGRLIYEELKNFENFFNNENDTM